MMEINGKQVLGNKQFFETQEEARAAYEQSIEDNKKFVEEELEKLENGEQQEIDQVENTGLKQTKPKILDEELTL
jgi:hypothetical protein